MLQTSKYTGIFEGYVVQGFECHLHNHKRGGDLPVVSANRHWHTLHFNETLLTKVPKMQAQT